MSAARRYFPRGLATLLRRIRRAPLLVEALSAYARTRRRMAREHDVRKLLAAARRNPGRASSDQVRDARRLAYAVSLTLALLPTDSRCLTQSLVLIELLARRGVDATLVIATSGPSDFAAHAWVELDGEPLLSPAGYAGGRLAEL